MTPFSPKTAGRHLQHSFRSNPSWACALVVVSININLLARFFFWMEAPGAAQSAAAGSDITQRQLEPTNPDRWHTHLCPETGHDHLKQKSAEEWCGPARKLKKKKEKNKQTDSSNKHKQQWGFLRNFAQCYLSLRPDSTAAVKLAEKQACKIFLQNKT